ncbi:hypothetical protein N7495_001933 [Penicillium taxi]|uniref:uncharacterized protein n=1 Tax=Penicillium taxi TaxID=168475 RepID=UPI002545BCF7|nr:uncharacterized protein N7495_001933 [Penicillium taxi]KAJ5909251.1 hypothetical protein N7495_001933 [Penicillium taxi]
MVSPCTSKKHQNTLPWLDVAPNAVLVHIRLEWAKRALVFLRTSHLDPDQMTSIFGGPLADAAGFAHRVPDGSYELLSAFCIFFRSFD